MNALQASQLTALQLLTAGGAAGTQPYMHMYHHQHYIGTLSWLLLYPFDTLKSNIQSDLRHQSTMQHHWNLIRKQPAPMRQLYKGLVTTLVRAYPVNAVRCCYI